MINIVKGTKKVTRFVEEEVELYQTSDGKAFDTYHKAEQHEKEQEAIAIKSAISDLQLDASDGPWYIAYDLEEAEQINKMFDGYYGTQYDTIYYGGVDASEFPVILGIDSHYDREWGKQKVHLVTIRLHNVWPGNGYDQLEDEEEYLGS